MNTYVYEWMLCECQNSTVPASRRNGMDGRTDGWMDRDDKCNEMFPISMHINQTFQTNIFAVDYE